MNLYIRITHAFMCTICLLAALLDAGTDLRIAAVSGWAVALFWYELGILALRRRDQRVHEVARAALDSVPCVRHAGTVRGSLQAMVDHLSEAGYHTRIEVLLEDGFDNIVPLPPGSNHRHGQEQEVE